MVPEWKQTRTVGEGGRIVVVVPELQGGEVVEVLVRRPPSPIQPARGERPIGLLKGQILIKAGFDEPLDEFDPYR
jgi:hypothetical protein